MTKRSQRRKLELYGVNSDGVTQIKTTVTYVDSGAHKATATFTSVMANPAGTTITGENQVYAYGGTINWGDGNTDNVGANATYSVVSPGVFTQAHTYAGAGTNTITWTPRIAAAATVSATVA